MLSKTKTSKNKMKVLILNITVSDKSNIFISSVAHTFTYIFLVKDVNFCLMQFRVQDVYTVSISFQIANPLWCWIYIDSNYALPFVTWFFLHKQRGNSSGLINADFFLQSCFFLYFWLEGNSRDMWVNN